MRLLLGEGDSGRRLQESQFEEWRDRGVEGEGSEKKFWSSNLFM